MPSRTTLEHQERLAARQKGLPPKGQKHKNLGDYAAKKNPKPIKSRKPQPTK